MIAPINIDKAVQMQTFRSLDCKFSSVNQRINLVDLNLDPVIVFNSSKQLNIT